MKDSLGYKIKRLRNGRGLTQDNVAYELGITKGAYNKIENGQTNVSVKRLYEIAKIFEVDILEFFKLSTSESKVEEVQKKYGFATRDDIEQIMTMVQELAREVNSLKATIHADHKKVKKSKK